MADISKIQLPSGHVYNIKDAVAREMISGGVSFIIAWDGNSTPDVTKIPEGVVVTYGGTTYTGTLDADDSTVQSGAFYLVKSSTSTSGSPSDRYDEYVPVGTAGSRSWEKIGDTQIDLSDVVTDVTLTKTTDVVLGEGTTFTAASSSVSFGTPSKDNALGEDTTFSVSQPTITVTPTTKQLHATASGTAVGANGTASPVTGYPNATTDTFVKSVTATTGKNLVVTTITPVDGTESVSKVTKTASKLVTTSVPNVTGNTSVSIPNVTGNTNVSVPNITSNSSITANKSTWTFEMGTDPADAETLIIGGGNGSDVSATNTVLGTANTASKVTLGTNLTATNTTLGTAITAATGAVDANGTGSDIVTAVTISDKTVAKAGEDVTVATGSTSESGTGDPIVSGVTVGSSGTAITGLGTPTTATVLTGVKVTAQPTISISDTGTGDVSVMTGVSSASASAQTITVGTNDIVAAVTAMPTGTAAAQTITVGTTDKVTVLTNGTVISVTKGNE